MLLKKHVNLCCEFALVLSAKDNKKNAIPYYTLAIDWEFALSIVPLSENLCKFTAMFTVFLRLKVISILLAIIPH